ncbi:MAG: 3-dehydroquinate synthase [Rikenellaceae bacterium]
MAIQTSENTIGKEVVRSVESLDGVSGCLSDFKGQVFVVADRKLRGYYASFEGCEIIEIEAKEKRKTMEAVCNIVGQLLERGADRDSLLVGFGSGITTDIVGFVASIYRRGISYVLIPTTLLAQVDAAIGGKNGVNFSGYKNMVGLISSPERIYLCSEVLSTLPQREFRAGVAEILKIFMIYDPEYYYRAVEFFASISYEGEEYLKRLSGDDKSLLRDIILRSVRCKEEVVKRDRDEKGERRLLNLGHTFGHAIERIALQRGVDIAHGEAVAIGMVVAAKVAEKIEGKEAEFSQKIAKDLEKVGLPSRLPEGVSVQDLFGAVSKDKKVSGEGVYFILPFEIGRVEQRMINLETLKGLSV